MSTYNICFYGELTKIILQLSSDVHLICSTGLLSASVVELDRLSPLKYEKKDQSKKPEKRHEYEKI